MTDPELHNTHDLADRLIAYEAGIGTLPPVGFQAAFRVCEKLRRPLTALAGSAGFHSLVSRALTLAKRESPSLGVVQIKADGSLDSSLENGLVGSNPYKYDLAAGTVLVARLLEMFFLFIGASLTLRLIHDIWPSNLIIGSAAEGTGEHEGHR